MSGTTLVSWYQKKHSPTHHPDHQSMLYIYMWQIVFRSKYLAKKSWFTTVMWHSAYKLTVKMQWYETWILYDTAAVNSAVVSAPAEHISATQHHNSSDLLIIEQLHLTFSTSSKHYLVCSHIVTANDSSVIATAVQYISNIASFQFSLIIQLNLLFVYLGYCLDLSLCTDCHYVQTTIVYMRVSGLWNN